MALSEEAKRKLDEQFGMKPIDKSANNRLKQFDQIDAEQQQEQKPQFDFMSKIQSGEIKPAGSTDLPVIRQATDLPESEIPKTYEDSFKGDVNKLFDDTRQNLKSDQDIGTKALHTTANVVRGVESLIGRTFEAGVDMLPDSVKESWKKDWEITKEAFINSDIGKKAIEALQGGESKWSEFEKKHPEDAQRVKDLFVITSIIPVGKAAKVGTEVLEDAGTTVKAVAGDVADVAQNAVSKVKTTTGELIEKAGTALDTRKIAKMDVASQKALDEAIQIGRPKLTKEMEVEAFKRGDVTQEGILGKRTVKPSTQDVRIGEALQPLVEQGRVSSKNPLGSGKEISMEVSRINSEVGNLLNDPKYNIPFDEGDLKQRLLDIKSENNILFGGDASIEKAYDTVLDEFGKFVKNKDTAGLFKARQEFDSFIRSKYPNIFKKDKFGNLNPADNAKKNAVFDTRRAVNEYVADMLASTGENIEGKAFTNALRKETYLLEALTNIAEKEIAGTIDTNRIQRLLKEHPWLKTAGGFVLGGATVQALSQ